MHPIASNRVAPCGAAGTLQSAPQVSSAAQRPGLADGQALVALSECACCRGPLGATALMQRSGSCHASRPPLPSCLPSLTQGSIVVKQVEGFFIAPTSSAIAACMQQCTRGSILHPPSLSPAHLSQTVSAALLCLQRFAQGNIVKRTIFELIAEEIMRNMPTPGASLHGGLSANGSEQSYPSQQRCAHRLPWYSCLQPLEGTCQAWTCSRPQP